VTRHDRTHWPLVITLERGVMTLHDTQILIDGWNHWLARVRKMNARKLFGIPVVSFDQLQHALNWLHKTAYAPQGWTLEFEAIGTTIGSMLEAEQ